MTKKIFWFGALSLSLLILVFGFVIYKKSKSLPSELICEDCNVILITMTNLRYDHMSVNGYFRPTTPNLDKLAKESLVFDNAFSHASWTSPARVSLYTGFYPFQHGFMGVKDGSNKLPQEIQTILEVLKKSGYTNAAFKGDNSLSDRFDEHHKCGPDLVSQNQKISQRYNESITYAEFSCTIPRALEWLKKNPYKKFFLHIQGFDGHCPFSQRGGKTYDPDYRGNVDFRYCLTTLERTEPRVINDKKYYLVKSAKEPVAEEVLLSQQDVDHLVAIYDESITLADREIGIFLDEIERMGLFDKTIIVFTSEHGDMFGKYGKFEKGGTKQGTYYDDVLHVPLIIRIPKLKAMRTDGLVGHVDIPQTILDFLGLEKLNRDGKSIVPLILRWEEVRKEVFAGAKLVPIIPNIFLVNKSYVAVIRTKKWKLIEEMTVDEDGVSSKNIELFDIVNDKEEQYNLKVERQDVLRSLQDSLNTWLRDTQK